MPDEQGNQTAEEIAEIMAWPPDLMSHEEITALARQIIQNEIWMATDPQVVKNSFLMASLVGVPYMTGAVWAPLADAGPMSVNGLPVFFTAHYVHFEDMQFLVSEVRRFADALGIDMSNPVPPREDRNA